MRRFFSFFSKSLLFVAILFSVACEIIEVETHPEETPPTPTYYEVLSDQNFSIMDSIETLLLSDEVHLGSTLQRELLLSTIERMLQKIQDDKGIGELDLGFRRVVYAYNSQDIHGNPLKLSAVAYWLGYYEAGMWHDLQPDRLCLMEHYTITSDAESPSGGFPVEMFITGNSLVILPDYIGYGITKAHLHPYLHHEICALNSIDALSAGYTLFDDQAQADLDADWELVVLGASQGSGNALAVHKYLDTHPEEAEKWHFAYSYSTSGPHNPILTMEKYFESGKTAYPVVYPMTLKTMLEAYPEILGSYDESDFYSEGYLAVKEEIDAMLASKEYPSQEINEVIYDEVKQTKDDLLKRDEIYLTDLLSAEFLNRNSQIFNDLCRCLSLHDLTRGWQPSHPIKLHYSSADRIVPAENTFAVAEAFGEEWVTLLPCTGNLDHDATCALWMVNIVLQDL